MKFNNNIYIKKFKIKNIIIIIKGRNEIKIIYYAKISPSFNIPLTLSANDESSSFK